MTRWTIYDVATKTKVETLAGIVSYKTLNHIVSLLKRKGVPASIESRCMLRYGPGNERTIRMLIEMHDAAWDEGRWK